MQQKMRIKHQSEYIPVLDEEIPYDPIPPNRTITVIAEIISKTRGEPLYSPLDEEELEYEEDELT